MVPRRAAPMLLCAALLAACSGATGPTPAAGTTPSLPPGGSPPTTATTTAAPSDPMPPTPDPDYLPDPGPPPGPPPSFNESAGCGPPAGVRGPYAAAPGFVPPGQVIAGPWGDYYGRSIADVRDRLVRVELPTTGGPADNVVYVHERVAPALQRVVDNLMREQRKGRYYRISVTSSYRPATVPPKRYLSFHAVGAVIDVNPAANPYREDNVLVTDMPDWFVHAWTDAGWCWGGAWQDIKDPMHFSWMGPLHSEGYEAFDPVPPATHPSAFERSLTFRTALEGTGTALFGDVDRDGAPDLVRIGRSGMVTARAAHRFETCRVAGPATVPPGTLLALADRTGDGRPDLWEIDLSSGRVVVTVATFASGYADVIRPVDTAIAAGPETVVLVGDHDRDGIADLHVVRPGEPAVVEVWPGPSFDTGTVFRVPLAVGPEHRFALGDRHGDGVPDLFALGPNGHLLVLDGSDGFGTLEEVDSAVTGDGTLHAGDVDGDGRSDLALIDGRSLTVYLGGDQTGRSDDELIGWFHAPPGEPWADDRPWAPGQGCPIRPGEIR